MRWLAIAGLCLVALPGCGESPDGLRDSARDTTGQTPVVRIGDPSADSTSALPPLPAVGEREAAAWFAVADSVMRVHLERSLYTSPDGFADDTGECEDDMGSDNPTTHVAAARTRIVGRDSLTVYRHFGPTENPTVARGTSYTVEVTSGARMIPNWIAGVEYRNDTIPSDEAYAMEVGPRVDTVYVSLADLGSMKPRWSVCAPAHAGSKSGYNFWTFAHEGRRWQKPVRWTPADASWARVRAIVDSLIR